jgi:hypothetical protein
MRKPEELTPLQRFQVEEEKIRADTATAQKHYDDLVRRQEKILSAARTEREKVAASLAADVADFERIEAGLEAVERERLDARGMTRKALDEGKISGAEFYKQGLTEGEVTTKARAVAAEKLTAMRDAIRAKGVKLLEFEVKEADAAFEADFGRVYPAMAMLERLKALVKNLEGDLSSPIGMGGMVSSQSARDEKRRRLNNATGKRLYSDGWEGYDLAGLKRLRLDPCFPAEQLPRLEGIITEAAETGRSCRLMLDPRDKRNPINLMWS